MSEVKHEVLLQAKGIYKNFETSKKDHCSVRVWSARKPER